MPLLSQNLPALITNFSGNVTLGLAMCWTLVLIVVKKVGPMIVDVLFTL